MRLTYVGPQYGGLDFPAYGILGWKPSEERDVPDELGKELLERGDFKAVEPVASWQEDEESKIL